MNAKGCFPILIPISLAGDAKTVKNTLVAHMAVLIAAATIKSVKAPDELKNGIVVAPRLPEEQHHGAVLVRYVPTTSSAQYCVGLLSNTVAERSEDRREAEAVGS
jgi:hypothetical protein